MSAADAGDVSATDRNVSPASLDSNRCTSKPCFPAAWLSPTWPTRTSLGSAFAAISGVMRSQAGLGSSDVPLWPAVGAHAARQRVSTATSVTSNRIGRNRRPRMGLLPGLRSDSAAGWCTRHVRPGESASADHSGVSFALGGAERQSQNPHPPPQISCLSRSRWGTQPGCVTVLLFSNAMAAPGVTRQTLILGPDCCRSEEKHEHPHPGTGSAT